MNLSVAFVDLSKIEQHCKKILKYFDIIKLEKRDGFTVGVMLLYIIGQQDVDMIIRNFKSVLMSIDQTAKEIKKDGETKINKS